MKANCLNSCVGRFQGKFNSTKKCSDDSKELNTLVSSSMEKSLRLRLLINLTLRMTLTRTLELCPTIKEWNSQIPIIFQKNKSENSQETSYDPENIIYAAKYRGFVHQSQLEFNSRYYHIELSSGTKHYWTTGILRGDYQHKNYTWGFVTAPILSMKRCTNPLRDQYGMCVHRCCTSYNQKIILTTPKGPRESLT